MGSPGDQWQESQRSGGPYNNVLIYIGLVSIAKETLMVTFNFQGVSTTNIKAKIGRTYEANTRKIFDTVCNK